VCSGPRTALRYCASAMQFGDIYAHMRVCAHMCACAEFKTAHLQLLWPTVLVRNLLSEATNRNTDTQRGAERVLWMLKSLLACMHAHACTHMRTGAQHCSAGGHQRLATCRVASSYLSTHIFKVINVERCIARCARCTFEGEFMCAILPISLKSN
jgi:hypothetical protein